MGTMAGANGTPPPQVTAAGAGSPEPGVLREAAESQQPGRQSLLPSFKHGFSPAPAAWA